jgi:rhodanese-related sulfurtransferase
MRRRIFLVLLLLMSAAASAWAQDAAPQVPPDRITLEEFKTLRADNKIFVLDVRLGATTKIKGASYIPLDQLETRLSELPTDREIVTYCS